jgi:hypothetical protein
MDQTLVDFKRFLAARHLHHNLRGGGMNHVAPSYTAATDHLRDAAQAKEIRAAKKSEPNPVSIC